MRRYGMPWFLIVICLITSTVWGQFGGRNQGQQSPEDVILPAPRSQSRMLRDAQEALSEKRYAEAISSLATLLQMDNSATAQDESDGQDYFIERNRKGAATRTLRSEAVKLLGTLPEEGRKTLEIQFGVQAQQALASAIAAHDFDGVQDVARRFVHTQAGNDALALIAQQRLADGQSLAAGNIFRTLLDYPTARDRYGVAIAQQAAVAFRQAGRRDYAIEVLRQAASLFPNSELESQGKKLKLAADADYDQIVEDLAGTVPQAIKVPVNEWMISGGSSHRNAVSTVGLPLANARWFERNHGSLKERDALNAVAEAANQQNNVILPKLEVRCVNNLVLSKTTDGAVFARDFESGRLQWLYFFHKASVDLTDNFGLAYSDGEEGAQVSEQLKTRVWGSSAYGNFSCDQERFYLVSSADDKQISAREMARAANTENSNMLEGISLAKEGALLWQVGGERSDAEPNLKGAYFVGPPLPYRGRLYIIADINDTTYLVVLDAASGKQLWRQQLLQNVAGVQDSFRRSLALTPTISDGVILCPTGSSAIVAVDLLTRGLLWARLYQSNRPFNNQQQMFMGGMGGDPFASFDPLEPRWHDPFVIASQGLVLATPPESDLLLCYDLLTGEPKWKNIGEKRGMARYIVGANAEHFVMAANSQLIAFHYDGQVAWELPFPRGHLLAGKGIWADDGMLIPLTGRKVIKVSMDGKLVDSATVDMPLGNLVAYQKQLLSISPTGVAAYYTRESLSEEVDQRLAKDANDTWALNRKSQMLVAEGKVDEAIASLEKSFQIDNQNADTRFLLVENLLNAFERDFEKYQSISGRYKSVFEDSPQRFRYLQCLAKGNIVGKRYAEAFDQLLQMMNDRFRDSIGSQHRAHDRLELSNHHTVDSAAWIASQLGKIYALATSAEREKMDQLLGHEVQVIKASVPTVKRQRLRYLNWIPALAQELLRHGDEAMNNETIYAERLLQPLMFHEDSMVRGAAGVILARGPADEWKTYGSHGNIFRKNQPIPIAQTTDAPEFLEQLKTPLEWPAGALEVAPFDGPMMFSSELPLPVTQNRYGRPSISVRYSQPNILFYNAWGDQCGVRFAFERGTADNGEIVRCQVEGGLILVETGAELLAVDMYADRQPMARRDRMLWRYSLQSPSSGPTREFNRVSVEAELTPFGFRLPKRSGAISAVGPVTPAGVLVQVGGVLSMLDLLTGAPVWSRDGFSDQTQFATNGLEVAVIDSDIGSVQILDCRDGIELRSHPYSGDWRHWFSHGPYKVEFSVQQDPGDVLTTTADNSVTIRVLNCFNDADPRLIKLAGRTRATVVDERFLVCLEPTGNRRGRLHLLDLDTNLYRVHDVVKDIDVDSIQGIMSQDRLIVFSFYSRNSGSAAANARSDQQALARESIAANGVVFGLNTADGSLAWNNPASMINYWVPLAQSSASPFLVACSAVRGGRVSMAIIDTRDASIAHQSSHASRPGDIRAERSSHRVAFQMHVDPVSKRLKILLDGRPLDFIATDNERSPQPVFWFSAPVEERTSRVNLEPR